jgi:hypothetical protein
MSRRPPGEDGLKQAVNRQPSTVNRQMFLLVPVRAAGSFSTDFQSG